MPDRERPVPTILAVTPTLCRLFGITPPALSSVAPLPPVLEAARERLGNRSAERGLIYAPDAIGDHLQPACPALFAEIARLAPVRVPLHAVYPSKTPVCFASMFTGALPAAHGIRKYERPILSCDTLFDALIRSGRRVAIVAVTDSSIDQIFRGRNLDYSSERYDPEVTTRARALIREDRHDLILAYHQEYDDRLHETTPFSESALRAFRHHVAAFRELNEAAERYWRHRDRVVLFAPDHGAHVDPESGTGTHGDDIPEDMELAHFYDIRSRDRSRPDPPGGAATI